MKQFARLLIVILSIAFFSVIFRGKTFYYGDNYALMVPTRVYGASQLKQGIFPFWNPYILNGVPFFADTGHSLLYPSTVAFMLFPPSTALNLTILVHLFLMGLGMYWFCRVLGQKHWYAAIGAVIFTFSGNTVAILNNLALLQSTTWLPWIFACLVLAVRDRSLKAYLVLPMLGVLEILAGHPQPPLLLGIVMLAYVIFSPNVTMRTKLKEYLVVVLMIMGMLAFVLVPFLQLSARSTRVHMTSAEVISGSLHPALLLHWVLPNVFSNAELGMDWGPEWGKLKQADGYLTLVGLAALLAFVRMRKKKTYEEKVLLLAAFVGLLLSLGKYLPFMQLLYEHVPVLRFIRNPSTLLVVWAFCTAALVGRAIEWSVPWIKKHARSFLWLGVLPLIIGTLLLTRTIWFTQVWQFADIVSGHRISHSSFHTIERDQIIVSAILFSSFFTLLYAWLVVHVLSRKKVIWIAVLIVITLDMWTAIKPAIFLAPSAIYDTTSPQADFLRNNMSSEFRYISANDYLPYAGFFPYFHDVVSWPPFANETRFLGSERQSFSELIQRQHNLTSNWGMAHNLQTIYGYETLVPERIAEYWKTDTTGSSINEVEKVALDDSRMNEQGVKYMLIDKKIFPSSYFEQRYPGWKVVEDFESFAVLENPGALPLIRLADQQGSQPTDIQIQTNIISFTANEETSTKIFIAQNAFPGWDCHIGENICHLLEEKGGMSLVVPPGESKVTMRFLPSDFGPLLGVSALSLGGYLLWAKWLFKRPSSVLV